MTSGPWTLARRAERLNPSIIREILKVTERPGIVSLAGGLPAAEGFPVEALREATQRVLCDSPREALQYGPSEGFGPLREWIAAEMLRQGVRVSPSQVLVTTGSQQGLDLCAKILVDPGAKVAVEMPTYLGALQAFAPYEPQFVPVETDVNRPVAEAVREARGARFMYVLPNFQNPAGRTIPEERRQSLLAAADEVGVPLLEDNPYGDLWYDESPPKPLAARASDRVIYLGSFSKILAPGLRLGWLVAPSPLFPKLLQAKQASDLHTPSFNQRLAYEVVREGFLERHLPSVRERYKAQRDAMEQSLRRWLAPLGCSWNTPTGGMFFWVELPPLLDSMALLSKAVDAGIAFVPGAAFYCTEPRANTMRLSFVTVSPERIAEGVEKLGVVIAAALAEEEKASGVATEEGKAA